MKKQISNSLIKKVSLGVLILMMMISFTSSAKKITFLNSSIVPSAKGSVKVKEDNDNYAIKLEINDLIEVQRLQTSKESYVVWLETERGDSENLGQLTTSTGFMSKRYSASLKTTSSFKPVRIFITAENEINTSSPDSIVILTTDKFYD